MTAPLRDRLTALPRHTLLSLVDRFERWERSLDAEDVYVKWADIEAALGDAPEGEADAPIYPHTVQDGETDRDRLRLRCNRCGQSVSTPFYPVKTDTPDGGLIVRAWIECPECLEKRTQP